MSDASADDPERPESHKKGDRHERQACNILNRRYFAERVPSIYGNNDPFRLADIMGVKEGLPVALVQVKTNRFTAQNRRYYRRWSSGRIDDMHSIFELWVRVDRDGWRMHRIDPESGEFSQYYQTSTCNPSDVRDEWAEAFNQTLQSDNVQEGAR